MDSEFPKGTRDQVEKIMEIPGGRGSNAKPSGTENPVGWGVKLEKNPPWGGMDIFWNHTIENNNKRHANLFTHFMRVLVRVFFILDMDIVL